MLLAALLFAIVQGITEFLPVSSSGHLRVTALLTGTPADGLFTVAVLHVVTATAAILYYRRAYWLAIRNVWKPGLPRGFALRYAAAQLATAAIALPLALGLAHTVVYRWWLSAWLIGAMMVVNAVVLVAAPRGNDFTDEEILPTLSWRAFLLVGLAQGISVVPGLSRSGLTVAAGLRLGLSRDSAVRISLLLAPPVMLAAAIVWSVQTWPEPLRWVASWQSAITLAGMVIATFAIAMGTLHWVVIWVRCGRLWWFAPWSAAAGVVTLIIAAVR